MRITCPMSNSLCSTVQLQHFSTLTAQGGRSPHQVAVDNTLEALL
ncbi:hypothetical protein M758_3G043000 [Ceratodon purpureus]|nr:hypothetical protein M758_3G043000 [Ceratodon purpureus]